MGCLGSALCAFMLAGLCVLGCSSSLVQIPRGPHPLSGGAAPLAVDSAPPPARIDEIRAAPASNCAWADGQWRWENNRWQWQPGAWVRFAPGCYYADSLMSWVPTLNGTGVLFYTHGQWYTSKGQPCSAPTPCSNAR
jgi:hypothetical protein